MYLHLDWETFSTVDITKAGAHRYAADPSTEIMLGGYAVDDAQVTVVEGDEINTLLQMLHDPDLIVVAFNAAFERLIIKHQLGIDLPPERFWCTQALAYSLGFSGSLSGVCKQMGFPEDKQKLDRARRMMLKFGKPRRASKHDDRTRWTKDMDPGGWQEYRDYCAQDVVASREVFAYCSRYRWHPDERAAWDLHQHVNNAGWPLDLALVENANKVRLAEESRLRSKLKQVTGLDNPNSGPQFTGWLLERGVELPNLQKETLEAVAEDLANESLQGAGRAMSTLPAIGLRLQLAKATPKKWDALARSQVDGRLPGTLKWAGASRTQRWSGQTFQPQNLYSEREYDTDELADILTHCDRDTIAALYGDVSRILSGAIRPAVTAPPGRTLVVCDKSSIESRVLGWMAGEPRINSLFARGEDTYKDLASRIFGVPVSQVTKQQRTFAKPPELGCGYMLGGKGLKTYAADMGVDMTEDEAVRVVHIWRESNPAVVQMWGWFDAVIPQVVTSYLDASGYGVRIHRDDRFLMIDLPSGRPIYYHLPAMRENNFGRWSFSYMGRFQDTGQWQRVFSHPGKVTENIDQAIARDCLRDDLTACYHEVPEALLVGHVHDEAVGECPDWAAPEVLARYTEIMSRTPTWAPGLLLDAEGFITRRYKKG